MEGNKSNLFAKCSRRLHPSKACRRPRSKKRGQSGSDIPASAGEKNEKKKKKVQPSLLSSSPGLFLRLVPQKAAHASRHRGGRRERESPLAAAAEAAEASTQSDFETKKDSLPPGITSSTRGGELVGGLSALLELFLLPPNVQ